MVSILTEYHDCDRVAVVVVSLIFWALMLALARHYDRREAFKRYERRRLAYSRRRLAAIRNLTE